MAFGVRVVSASSYERLLNNPKLFDSQLWSYRRLTAAGPRGMSTAAKRGKSTAATANFVNDNRVVSSSAATATAKDTTPLSKDPLDLEFSDHRNAFKSKTNSEILRALLVYGLCSNQALVRNSQKIMSFGLAVLGEYLFSKTMKATFYGQFVAGEDQESIQPRIKHLRSFGVKSILDYSVEEDVSTEKAQQMEMQ